MKNVFALAPVQGSSIPNEVYGYTPYLLSFSAAWASAMYGYDSAFIGGTIGLPSFQRAFHLTESSPAQVAALSSNIVSTFQAGAFFGCIIGFFSAEKLGRKPVILGSAVVFIAGVVLQLIGLLGLLYGGRALTGVAIGASSTMIPIYIAECAPALIRGRLVGIFEIMLQTALVFGFWVNYGVARNISPEGNKQWHIPVAVQFIPAGLLLATVPLFCPESPRWLMSKNHVEKARKALSWIRNLPADHEYINTEMAEIQASIAHEMEVGGGDRSIARVFKELSAPGIRWRVAMGAILMLLQNLTGINAINYYSPTILRSIGFSGTDVGLLATGVYGLVKMLTTLVFMLFIVDRFGRRPALLVGAVGAMVAMFYLAAYSSLSGSFKGTPPADGGSRAALAMIYVYAIFYGFSWNGIPWIFASEVLPNQVRTLGMMVAVCTQWLAQFVVVYSLPYMVQAIEYGTFVFFGTCTVVAFFFAWFFVPETKGVELEDMDLLFSADAPMFAREKWKRYVEAKRAGVSASVLYGEKNRAKDGEAHHFEDC